jgi:hypothetical protein
LDSSIFTSVPLGRRLALEVDPLLVELHPLLMRPLREFELGLLQLLGGELPPESLLLLIDEAGEPLLVLAGLVVEELLVVVAAVVQLIDFEPEAVPLEHELLVGHVAAEHILVLPHLEFVERHRLTVTLAAILGLYALRGEATHVGREASEFFDGIMSDQDWHFINLCATDR